MRVSTGTTSIDEARFWLFGDSAYDAFANALSLARAGDVRDRSGVPCGSR